MKTFSPTPKDIKHDWYVVDAQDQVLGRLASQIAHRLRGKHKPTFAPHVDCGDHVIIINCKDAVLTGGKAEKKYYYRQAVPPSLRLGRRPQDHRSRRYAA